ncbi:MAG: hypothetical protein ACFFA6_03370 [Promethearchaeota archaeon]
MELFKWLKEIEQVYEELIENARKDSIDQIQFLEKQQERDLKKLLKEKKSFVNSTLSDLSNEVKDYLDNLKTKNSELIKKLELNYNKNKKKLIQSIIEKLGYDF